MKKIDCFTNCYSLSKTLRFKLIPVGKTQEKIDEKRLIAEDEKRAEDYKRAKKIIDRYHIYFINKVLKNVRIQQLLRYEELFAINNKDDGVKNELLKLEMEMRKSISNAFKKDDEYKFLFKKEIIEKILPEFLVNEEEKQIINSFKGFSTAFRGYQENRANLYTDEEISSSIAYRLINENLPKFISNKQIFNSISSIITEEEIEKINQEILGNNYSVDDFFTLDFFDFVLTQDGIDTYNAIIGGITKEDGTKVKGLNEYINLFNQKNKQRNPKLKFLYKQVLTESMSKSFIIDSFSNDDEVLDALRIYFDKTSDIMQAISLLKKICSNHKDYHKDGIYIKSGLAITTLSNDAFDSWSVIRDKWNEKYDLINMKNTIKNLEKYNAKRDSEYKKIDSFSIEDIEDIVGCDVDLITVITGKIDALINIYDNNYSEAVNILEDEFHQTMKLQKDEKTIEIIKKLLDSVKDIEKYIKPLVGTGKEGNRDEFFYSEFESALHKIESIDNLYNKVRNYVTKDAFSKEKFKLYFQNPQFMGGWDKNKESDYRTAILRKNNNYYLAVMDKSNSKCLQNISASNSDLEKMNYILISGASKSLPHVFFSKKYLDNNNVDGEILRIYQNKTFIKGDSFNLSDCHKIIDYYKAAISKHSWGQDFDFHFSETEKYEDISGFFSEVDDMGYKLSFEKVSEEEIDILIEAGILYLFQIYNKDFSERSHGMPNLHTMYFKALFDSHNNGKIRLCGGAEMFLRRASVNKEELVKHPANKEMKNKNPDNPKKTTILPYDIYKDKRYSEDQYEIHIPISINKIPDNNIRINTQVRKLLRNDSNPYVIGIDRGERNLLYIVVVDGEGNIIEQISLNEIVNETNGIKITTDYHKKLDTKEKERLAARQSWKTIENIKELKEGYISQVIHKICELVYKYDAVIALEDLNSGFKNSRIKVEKQVYQKFEKKLIDKLNYMVDKKYEYTANGGVINGYQLTNKFESFKKMGTQNGIMFYIPAWLTSKIDPSTGFVNLLKTKYVSINESKKFIEKITGIRYDTNEKMFVFSVDYDNFERTAADYKKKWEIYSYGDRVRMFRNKDKNNEFDYEIINVTEKFIKLFEEYEIDFFSGKDIKEQLLAIDEKVFFETFLGNVTLMLQMRNSISGRTDVDYLISPVKNDRGDFYDSRDFQKIESAYLPKDADANGAYNIARKVLWAIEQFKNGQEDELDKVKIAISNKEWLEYAQTHFR
jgi:CRISPR-associated protein Cpf1